MAINALLMFWHPANICENLNTYFYVSLPTSAASMAAHVRLFTPSFARMRSTCFSIVRGLTLNDAPILRLVAPLTSHARTWRSRGVSSERRFWVERDKELLTCPASLALLAS